MVDSAIIAWFVLTALSAAYVAWDSVRNNPELRVWLVAAGLKHGMGTKYVLGKGGHEPEQEITTAAPVLAHGSHGPRGWSAAPLAIARKYTRPQLAAVTLLTLLALGGGIVIGDLGGDLSMRPGTMGAAADHPGM